MSDKFENTGSNRAGLSLRSVITWLSQFVGHLSQEFLVTSRIVAFAAGAALIVVVGPFGTFDMPIAKRAGFWISWFATVWVVSTVLFAALQSDKPRTKLTRWQLSVIAFLISVPIAALFGVSIALGFFPRLTMSWHNLFLEAKFLSPIVGCIIIILHMSMRPKQRPQVPAPETNQQGNQFFERLPKDIGRSLVCISVSDHYLKVETLLGEAFILGSLTEAVSQLDGYPGSQVHRSHWVALDAIKDREWIGQKMQLNLANGTTVPVSRSFRSQILELLGAVAA